MAKMKKFFLWSLFLIGGVILLPVIIGLLVVGALLSLPSLPHLYDEFPATYPDRVTLLGGYRFD